MCDEMILLGKTCADCNGDGYIVYETGITHEGYVELSQDYCETCEGTGKIKHTGGEINETS